MFSACIWDLRRKVPLAAPPSVHGVDAEKQRRGSGRGRCPEPLRAAFRARSWLRWSPSEGPHGGSSWVHPPSGGLSGMGRGRGCIGNGQMELVWREECPPKQREFLLHHWDMEQPWPRRLANTLGSTPSGARVRPAAGRALRLLPAILGSPLVRPPSELEKDTGQPERCSEQQRLWKDTS